jgi:hypothetical protein
MNALTRYVVNTAQAKTGLSSSVLIGYLAQAGLGVATVVLLLVAVFFVFSDYFGFGGTKTSIGMFTCWSAAPFGPAVQKNVRRTRHSARSARRRRPSSLDLHCSRRGCNSAALWGGDGFCRQPL